MRYKWLIIILVILAVALGLFWRFGLVKHLLVKINTPECSNPVLTVAPSGDENIDSITPLGNISLPQHALPTEHTYHMLKRGPDGLPLDTEIFSPANLIVTTITHISSIRDGQQRDNDYKVDMVPCKKVGIQFDHIRELSPKLATAYAASKPRCQEYQRAGDLNKYCRVDVSVKLSVGESMGLAGRGLPAGFDFGATDLRTKPLEFASNKRYGSSTRQTICPYDLYGKDMKDRLYKMLGDNVERRVIEPICGTIAQDVPGTAQGNWFEANGKANNLEQSQKTLSLIHDNVDPKLGLLVSGRQNTKVIFSPVQAGFINREFAQVKPGGQMYCYQPDSLGNRAGYGTQSQFQGSVLISLPSESELDIEFRTTDCSKTSFTQSTRYIR